MTTTIEPTPFDLAAPLPTGTVALEASAGTGKTFTIAGLATRWVAETEVRLPQLLVVTFTRAATAELRDRVRARLVHTADHVEAVLAGGAPDTEDPVLAAVLGDLDEDELRVRLDRLHRAVTDVDVATISTIHGFCQHVLDGLGIASDLDRDAELIEDVRDLVEEVVDDVFVTTYLDPDDHTPRISRSTLLDLGHAAVRNPTTPLVPGDADDPAARLRVALAARIRDEVARRARQRRQLSFDDLLTRLDATLRDADRGGGARAALRSRYRVVLIDEFQDTDPVQWSIVRRAFTDTPDDPADDGRALVLIGDPKQAIYAFRGADVHAYLDAATGATTRHTLPTCWRADEGLLRGLEAMFDGVRFGHEDIPFRRVQHAPGHDAPRMTGAPVATPLRIRQMPRHDTLGRGKTGMPYADRTRDLVATDVAADVVRLLSSGAELVDRDPHGVETDRRRIVPGDIAVLVRTHDQAATTQSALRSVDVPSVVGGAGSVFDTPAATDWRRLLEALERPASDSRVRALALSSWIGWTADDLARARQEQWDDLHEQLHQWTQLLRDRGVAATFRTIGLQREVHRRLLGVVGGERVLADLEHIAELAHAAAVSEHLGAAGLLGWFLARVAEARDERTEERLRRLETDHDAVQILTIHGAKGLEFPVVYAPFLWSSNTDVRGAPTFHDPTTGERRLDVGGDTHARFEDHEAIAEAEARAEELRLLYVAVTRACHQVVAWYAPAGVPAWSGLGRVLLNRGPDGAPDVDAEAPLLEDDEIAARLSRVAAAGDGAVAVETVPEDPDRTPWQPEAAGDEELDRARFTRRLDVSWRRTSYSALIDLDAVEVTVGSESPERVKDDEELEDPGSPGGPVFVPDVEDGDDLDALRTVPLPLADMPGGRHVGTLLHAVLEHSDFTADDLEAEVGRTLDRQLRSRPIELDRDGVVAGLVAAISTPLGPTARGISLADLGHADRRDEVTFELPLDRHEVGGGPATVGDLAELMVAHLGADDPLAAWPATLPEALLGRTLRGYLGGSIDMVARRHTDDGPVFHVADHKSNRLGSRDEPLTAFDYRPEALAEAMIHGDYPLQALLYAVALHRILRWRLPDYDPERNLGSVLYLFLRGMAGPDTPAPGGTPCGVFAWQPPASLVVASSDLLHGTVHA